MIPKRSVLLLLVLVGMLLSYGIVVIGQEQPAGGGEKKECNVTYANFGKGFMEKYCTRCHTSENHNFFSRWGAPKGFDFNTYAGIKDKAQRVKDMTVTRKTMPKGRHKPTDEERKQLGIWIDCGVPE